MATTPLLDPVQSERRAAAIEAAVFRECFTPPPELSILEWAERHRELAKETAEPGKWRADRVPYLTAPLKALSDPRVREVTIKKSAQSGATEGVVLNTIFYHVDYDPAPMLAIYPTEGEAEKFSKKKLAPAVRDTPRIAGKIADPRSRKGDSTILEKTFPGGSLGIISGATSRGFRMVSARVIIGDDLDSLDPDVSEGDQVTLARQRANAYWNAKFLWVSSPGDARTSKIEPLYEEMERRGRFHVPCPHCGAMQVLRFGGPDTPFGLKWDREEVDGKTVHRPETAAYLCESCSALIDESHKYTMISAGDYLTDEGEPVLAKPARSYGFWYNALVSTFPAVSWENIVREFLKAKGDPAKLKVVVNTLLAETWEEKEGDELDTTDLEARAEAYRDAQGQRIELPMGVGVLTAFVDVQHDRLELLIRGWGAREESWLVAHHRIYGDVSLPHVWQQLDALRTRSYRHEGGATLRILALGVDSGDGTRQNEIYDYVRPRRREGVWATKGQPARQREPIKIGKKDPKSKIKLVHIGTHPMKATLFSRLGLRLDPDREVPFGYMHFRAIDPDWHNGADAEFYAQFGREKRRPKRLPSGHWVTEWIATGPNEAVDLEVGNLAMLHVLGPATRQNLERLVETVREEGEVVRQGQERPAEEPRRRHRIGWVGGGGW